MTTKRLIDVTLDESTIRRWSPEVDHERRVAIFDLLEDNSFDLVKSADETYPGPYKLHLSIQDGRLAFDVSSEGGDLLFSFRLSLTPLRRIIKDYFDICDSYYEAIRTASTSQIEAIDMGRRGLHNEGSEKLKERLDGKVVVDMATARRLFTLVCVLQLRDGRGPR